MKSLISLLAGTIAALLVTGIEERVFGQPSGWLEMIVAVSVFVICLHRLQIQERHN